ncbi:hypothetical protein DSM07_03440 [Oenococcus sp. UCMA 16435]|nr:hypothetical protein DSM07_03440 [Oenococcus sp. UCMA 16435]
MFEHYQLDDGSANDSETNEVEKCFTKIHDLLLDNISSDGTYYGVDE